ncbi:hypothetical protein E3E11_06280 [Oecophyllibacter saccharovorans]|uniref:Uncharacterized protein n=1 Tax=Oecophyllibacter saccharovorans TaxID=2558360 RepID=A0A506UM93_9PROT|nr:hypothetical protein [Oecophyllibacter saccharovorans]QDH15517.1 hypothetical protein E3E11_06280 [Oecophyllibacter saccharovorans]TPW34352.1 hypothetical protein E3202_07635 [Oecophyllibacter saccharovorans]
MTPFSLKPALAGLLRVSSHAAPTALALGGLLLACTLPAAPALARKATHRAKAPAAAPQAPRPAGHPVVLTAHPGSGLEAVARSLSADELKEAARHHDHPIILTASAPLAPGHKNMALFVQLQSAGMCGSAGCATSVFLRHGKKWDNVIDSVNGGMSILPTRHQGLYDILIDNDDKWIWNGKTYQDTLGGH